MTNAAAISPERNFVELPMLSQDEPVNLKDNAVEDNASLQEYIRQLQKQYSMNSDILFVQMPQFNFESFSREVAINRGYYAFPPTGLQCLAKAIIQTGKYPQFDFFDLNYQILKKVIEDPSFDLSSWLSILDQYLQKQDHSIICITSLTSYSDVLRPSHPLTAILQHLKKKEKYLIIIGGPTATNEFENYLRKGLCHFVLTREGEHKIQFLWRSLFEDESTAVPVAGIYFYFNQKVQQTKGKRELVALQGNLIETYKPIHVEEYCKVGCLNPYSRMAGQNTPFGVFQLHRGCRANCRFCDVTKFMGRGTRHYPVEDVVKEMQYLVEQRGVRHFEVLDDDFLGSPAALDLLRQMVSLRQQYGITWAASNGLIALSLTEETLRLIRDSGCIGFRIGIESGNPEMLKRIRKPATLPSLRQKAALLQNFPEIFVGGNYILGLFGEETFAQMMDTFRFSCEMDLDWSSLSTFQFTSKETAIVEKLQSTGGIATEFTPAKDSATGEIPEMEGIVSGPAIFSLPPDAVPSPLQVKQIWFTFNLVGNYLFNKNLLPGGNTKKLVSWLEALQVSYPYNPYMPLFTGLGYVLLGEREKAQHSLEQSKALLDGSEYWQHRFAQFKLNTLVDDFPKDVTSAYAAINALRQEYLLFTRVTRAMPEIKI